jgi:Undecaprenyl-phosphate glucose phosphotransferase
MLSAREKISCRPSNSRRREDLSALSVLDEEKLVLKRYQRTVGDLFRILDACVVVAAWLLAYWVRFYASPFDVTKGFPAFETYATLSPLVAVLWMAVFTWMRVYESRRMVGRLGEVFMVLRAHGLALLLFIAITYLFDDYKYSRLVLAYFTIVGAIGLTLFRIGVRSTLRRMRARGYNLRHVLAVGEGPTLESLVTRLDRFPELGLRVVGVVTSESCRVDEVGGKPVLGHFRHIRHVLARTKVDEVLIALAAGQQQEADLILDLIQDETLDIRLVPDVLRYVTLGCELDDFDGLPVLRLNDSPLVGTAAYAKRATDIAFSALALAVLSPIMLLVAALVKLTSIGPVLYGQERMGLDGRTFRMLKFRSMRLDAERTSGAIWARAGDHRCTPLGAILRKTSLDELPQFWNVLRGDMSLVGPRPERPVFVTQFRSQVPHYMLRHKVKSGITGWAQVNGWRGNTSLTNRIECDLFYIRNWSLSLDLKILTMTIWKGFINKNAY